ncbi:AAA family ATPase [Haloechinothrix sp. LS1_15]|uniref:AAA family ATPase n=1 Tax=Haloechinothrix sp. LS1_15 TaxID=2652248 RepID=UPI0029440CA3|nr:AAA family ATPase [Haloechinothrix sp. LS1_15]MDV6013618.1 AAA domain-containing protein [Haloechinothrix sp. LS1_15]
MNTSSDNIGILRPREGRLLRGLLWELKKVIVGYDMESEEILVALLAGGHCLIEGMPGVAKTMTVHTLARAVDVEFTRIQFTPDLVPSDIVGTRIYRASTERFDLERGPIFTNFALADEINRAPAKVQSALLEVMAERQVSMGGQTLQVPRPFLVLATQNPIETEGVYPLPEAQRDRFLMKVLFHYPDLAAEIEIARRMSAGVPAVERVLSSRKLVELQDIAAEVYVDPTVLEYAATVVMATRRPMEYGLPDLSAYVACGASPRATLGLIAAARALALIHGRGYALGEDVHRLAHPVLRHRLVLTYQALADNVVAGDIVSAALSRVPAPRHSSLPTPAPRPS